ncbi:MAG: 50S ribosomal protein L21e [Candidatus Aenigmatarchaeota archaeon]|nr:MAG: 50S ribosomal protein L21e [Candidatus Aenigmarchaeota archaeon]RLJ07588.1 MAG: 50S ribosomal protein L21e [Candidatus Aenigmarchaeota archaeon]
MTTSGKGYRSRTRKKLRKRLREKFTVTRFLQEFKTSEKVIINPDPFSQKAMPHVRFKGKVGTVKEKRGRAYVITVKTGKREKEITARPEHLKPLQVSE